MSLLEFLSMRINEAVGDFLKRYRVTHNLTLDDVATASRRYGSGWIAASVRNIEKGGGKADSLPTLLVLMSALNDLHKDVEDDCYMTPVRLSDLIDSGDDMMRLNNDFEAPGWVVLGMIRGDCETLGEFLTADDDMGGDSGEGDGDLTKFFLEHVPTAAERRAAWRCGYEDAEVFSLVAFAMYGRTYDAEVRARAGEDSTPQKRGRVARVLDDEIQGWTENSCKDDGISEAIEGHSGMEGFIQLLNKSFR